MAVELRQREDTCTNCGEATEVVDRFQDYSTTRGPMVDHVITRCTCCGQRRLLHLAAAH